jgi:acyl dehydratase
VPLNRDLLGRQYPAAVPYEVGRESIRRFAEAVGDLHPAYLDPQAARSATRTSSRRRPT